MDEPLLMELIVLMLTRFTAALPVSLTCLALCSLGRAQNQQQHCTRERAATRAE